MKISVITVCFNSAATIRDTIESVLSQRYSNLEYIIVDGGSTDNTMAIVNEYGDRIARMVSEPDRGIYDAMNKGVALATGDVVGFLNADDFYADADCVSDIAREITEAQVDSVFCDLVFVRPDNLEKVVRYYNSGNFHPGKFARGWMPAHPTFYCKKACYDQYGGYQIDYKIAADYELLTRFLYTNRVSYHYFPRVLVKMRTGGASTQSLRSNWILNQEILRACRENNIQTNWVKVLSKYLVKMSELVFRPR